MNRLSACLILFGLFVSCLTYANSATRLQKELASASYEFQIGHHEYYIYDYTGGLVCEEYNEKAECTKGTLTFVMPQEINANFYSVPSLYKEDLGGSKTRIFRCEDEIVLSLPSLKSFQTTFASMVETFPAGFQFKYVYPFDPKRDLDDQVREHMPGTMYYHLKAKYDSVALSGAIVKELPAQAWQDCVDVGEEYSPKWQCVDTYNPKKIEFSAELEKGVRLKVTCSSVVTSPKIANPDLDLATLNKITNGKIVSF